MPQTLIRPKALQPGDTIAIISPAGATPYNAAQGGPDPFLFGASLLEQAGFRVKLMPNAKNKQLYLAGSDADRLADLHAAFADPDVNGILCARGGYGCMRLLPFIDFNQIAQNPKVFIGFSDITSLLIPFYERAGLTGFYGPMLTSNLVHGEPYSQAELFRLITGQAPLPFEIPNLDAYHCFQPGVAKGRLIGGNLSLLSALCGTEFQPKTSGHLLFIEDWHEKYYTLDRQFQQLKMAGLFDDIQGLILCDFSEIETEPEQTLPEFLRDLTAFLEVPVGFGFSVGHGAQTATLPIGTQARFDAKQGTITLLEPCVHSA